MTTPLIEATLKHLSLGISEAAAPATYAQKASNALAQAKKHKAGSDEHHKWMGVHHWNAYKDAKSKKNKSEAEKHHDAYEHHLDNTDDEQYFVGKSHHWK